MEKTQRRQRVKFIAVAGLRRETKDGGREERKGSEVVSGRKERRLCQRLAAAGRTGKKGRCWE